jgi:23S rRNA pseudouridine1911/1915/1917 synthase
MKAKVVVEEESEQRLDKLLCDRFPSHSRSYFQFLIEKGAVLLSGKPAKKREKPRRGDAIEIDFLPLRPLSAIPEPIALDILYEDQWIIAINKPAGLVVHPGAGSPSGTFVNALLHHCQTLDPAAFDPLRPGIVHRLDKDTTGVLLAAKTPLAHQKLSAAFKERTMSKSYLAICLGIPQEGLLSAPIKRHPTRRQEMAVLEGGKEACSDIRVLAHRESLSLVSISLLTGRTHQIRVHLKHLGCPILGDSVYGSPSVNQRHGVYRQLLHAEKIKFTHPITGELLPISCPPPSDMEKIIAYIQGSPIKL